MILRYKVKGLLYWNCLVQLLACHVCSSVFGIEFAFKQLFATLYPSHGDASDALTSFFCYEYNINVRKASCYHYHYICVYIRISAEWLM